MAITSRKKQVEAVAVETPPIQVFPTAIYARLAVENSGKDDNGAALENQIAVCEEYIKACPYLKLVQTYSDNGRTGTVFYLQASRYEQIPPYLRQAELVALYGI